MWLLSVLCDYSLNILDNGYKNTCLKHFTGSKLLMDYYVDLVWGMSILVEQV